MPTYKVRLRDRSTNQVQVVDVDAASRLEASDLCVPRRNPSVTVESIDEVPSIEPSPQPSPQHPHDRVHHASGIPDPLVSSLTASQLRIIISRGVMWGHLRMFGLLIILSLVALIILGIIAGALRTG